jgi:FtsZ-binding cell division protein ZapB
MLGEQIGGLEARVVQAVGRLRTLQREVDQNREQIAEFKMRLFASDVAVRELREENRALRAASEERAAIREAKVHTIRRELGALLAQIERASVSSPDENAGGRVRPIVSADGDSA